MRQQLLELGDDALELLTAIVHRGPRHAYEHVERLHALLMDHGEDAMRVTLDTIVRANTLDVRAVERALASTPKQGEQFGPRGAR